MQSTTNDTNDTNEHAPITEAELVEIEGLAAKATPGPWEADGRNLYAESYKGPQNRDGCVAVMVAPMDNDGHRPYHNAELIAAAVNALPRLIAEVRRLREEMPMCIAQIAPGESRKLSATSEYTRIYIQHVPPPPPTEVDDLESEADCAGTKGGRKMISERLNAYIAEQNLRLLTDPRFKTVKTERGVVQLSVNGWGLQGGRDFQWFPTLEAAVEYYGGEVKT